DKHLFRALAQYWSPTYNYFTFGKVDLVPTVKKYTTLLCCSMIQTDKAYFRAVNVSTFLKKLMSITGMSEQWVVTRIKQKGDSKCIPWKSLWDLILAHPDTKKRVDVFALSIYGLVIFPKALGRINEAILDLFDWLDKRIMPVPVILVETFRSLSAYRRVGDNYKKKVCEISNAWNQTHRMKRFTVNPVTMPEYNWEWGKRVNDNIPMSSQENTRPIEEHL
ncbi:hypothetical protein Golob_007868, partial [Gossypium lobatum]|nr:hypothetical protein [Gossypium lobatum]